MRSRGLGAGLALSLGVGEATGSGVRATAVAPGGGDVVTEPAVVDPGPEEHAVSNAATAPATTSTAEYRVIASGVLRNAVSAGQGWCGCSWSWVLHTEIAVLAHFWTLSQVSDLTPAAARFVKARRMPHRRLLVGLTQPGTVKSIHKYVCF